MPDDQCLNCPALEEGCPGMDGICPYSEESAYLKAEREGLKEY